MPDIVNPEIVHLANDGATDYRVRVWGGRRVRAEELKQIHWPTWIMNWKYYRNFIQPLTDPTDWWRSNESIPTIFKIVETLLPRYVLGMFETPDWFTVEARNQRSEEYENLCYNLLRQVVEKMRPFPKVYEALKYATIMGHAWGKVIWREEWQDKQVLKPSIGMEVDPETGEPRPYLRGVDQEITTEEVFNGPDFDWVTLDRVWPDPTGRGRWYIEEMDTTVEELVEAHETMKKATGEGLYDEAALQHLMHWLPSTSENTYYGGLDALSDARRGTTVAGVSTEYMREPLATENIPWHTVSPMRDGVGVKLWQCWGWVPPECRGADGIAWRMSIIANGSFVLRDIPCPTPDMRPPYFPIRSVIIPGRLFGASVIEYVGPLVDQQSRLSNMRLDEVYLNIWQQFLARKGSIVSDNQTLFQPGGFLELAIEPGQSLNDVFQRLDRRPVVTEAYTEDQYRQTQAEHAAAASDVMQGISAGGRQTATEVERLLQQGNARHALQVMLFDYTFKKEFLERTWRWLTMRLTKQEMVSMGEEYGQAPVNLMDIQIPIDIIVGGGLFALSKAARVSMDQELVQLLAIPQFAQVAKPDKIFQQLLQDRGWKKPTRFIKTPEELEQEQRQAQAMATLQGALKGGPVEGDGMATPPGLESPGGMDEMGLPQGGSMPDVSTMGPGAGMGPGVPGGSALPSNPGYGG